MISVMDEKKKGNLVSMHMIVMIYADMLWKH